MIVRALIGAVAAALITAMARRFGTLSESGQWTGFACGVCVSAAGWPWVAVLVSFFALASGVTAVGAARKARRTNEVLPQVAERSGRQVLANGAVFAALALAANDRPDSTLALAAAGALAAASADTWATEIGTLWGGAPRSLFTGDVVLPGMSGGVTVVGTLGAVAGGGVVSAVALASGAVDGGTRQAAIIVAAGLAGAIVDSALGATAQARRWCERCATWTERRVHPCGYRTIHARGLRWLSNDVVNLASTVAGAAGAVALAYFA